MLYFTFATLQCIFDDFFEDEAEAAKQFKLYYLRLTLIMQKLMCPLNTVRIFTEFYT